jgi:hypothetical protein
MADGERSPVVRLSEVRDDQGNLTHKMCCICFEMTSVEDLWVDPMGVKWDICSAECAMQAGH